MGEGYPPARRFRPAEPRPRPGPGTGAPSSRDHHHTHPGRRRRRRARRAAAVPPAGPRRRRVRRGRAPQPPRDRGDPPGRDPRAGLRGPPGRHGGLGPGAARRLPPRGHRAGRPSAAAATGWTSPGSSGAATQLYPQTDVFVDLADARERDGGDVRFGVTDVAVEAWGPTPARPVHRRRGRGARARRRLRRRRRRLAQPVPRAGAAGGASAVLPRVPLRLVRDPHRGAPERPELIYNHSPRGFALISSRTESLQRMYFQCDPGEDVADWSDDRIWEELTSRVGANGYTLRQGPITSRSVLPFRSFVQEPMHHGRLVLVGDAAHTVPPHRREGPQPRAGGRPRARRGARARGREGDPAPLETYSERALGRVGGPSTSRTG